MKPKRRPQKKKIDKIVKGVCIYWVLFVIVAWVTYWVKDGVPDTLIQYGLGGSVLELVMTALIEISRDKYSGGKQCKEKQSSITGIDTDD